jgi:hypothetical protein
VDRGPVNEWEPNLHRILAQVRRATGLDLEASLRWVSAEEPRDADDEFNRKLNDPGLRVVRVGSTDSETLVRPWGSYEGYWALELPDQVTMVQDPAELVDVIEDYVIDAVWATTGTAPRPGFLDGV